MLGCQVPCSSIDPVCILSLVVKSRKKNAFFEIYSVTRERRTPQDGALKLLRSQTEVVIGDDYKKAS